MLVLTYAPFATYFILSSLSMSRLVSFIQDLTSKTIPMTISGRDHHKICGMSVTANIAINGGKIDRLAAQIMGNGIWGRAASWMYTGSRDITLLMVECRSRGKNRSFGKCSKTFRSIIMLRNVNHIANGTGFGNGFFMFGKKTWTGVAGRDEIKNQQYLKNK